MKKFESFNAGLSIMEVMISMSVLAVVMFAAITGTTAITGSMVAAENYSVGQLAAIDYLTLDLRRASGYSFTTSGSNLTLPLTLELPQYYAADGRTPTAAQRTKQTTTNKKNKKDHKVVASQYYYHYGTLGSVVPVQYYLQGGNLYRKEGSKEAREIGKNISAVTFTSPAAAADATAAVKQTAIALDPVVTTKVEFLPTRRSKVAPPPLANSTFMRQFYYSDY